MKRRVLLSELQTMPPFFSFMKMGAYEETEQ